MPPHCYVIAHTSSPVVGDCVRSLEQHGWNYKIFPAVDGSKVTQADWDAIGIPLSDQGKMGRRLGAQGCWLSHFALWKKCIELQTPIVILEHDALVTDSWPQDIEINKNLVKLYKTAECKINPSFGRWSKGSHAYTITPVQAKILIEDAKNRGAQAVDKHLGDRILPWNFYHRDLVVLNPRRGPSSTSRITSK